MRTISTTECMGYSIFSDDLMNLPERNKLMVNTINQYSYCVAKNDAEFKDSLKNSDILLPDGIGIVLASKFLKGIKIEKIAGSDLHAFLLKKMNAQKGSVFYMGSSVRTLKKIKKRLKMDFPRINVETYSPPFKSKFSDADNEKIINVVNAFKPDILFVGLTAPKQEKWACSQKTHLNAKMICSIGAVFDFYAGTVKRPSPFWVNSGLEWLGRLLNEPKRMWKRYIYYGVVFGYYLIQEKFKTQIFRAKTNSNTTSTSSIT